MAQDAGHCHLAGAPGRPEVERKYVVLDIFVSADIPLDCNNSVLFISKELEVNNVQFQTNRRKDVEPRPLQWPAFRPRRGRGWAWKYKESEN